MTTIQPISGAATAFLALALAVSAPAQSVSGQSVPGPDLTKPHPMTRSERGDLLRNAPVTVFHLKYATQNNDANEILTGLRLMMDPDVKLYLVTRDNTIILRGLPDDVAMATTIVNDLDRPRTSYRLTFTLSDYEGTRKLSSSDYSMTLLDGQRTTLRQGSRIPVVTGKAETAGQSQTQMTYVDIGLNLDVTVNSNETGAVLKSKVEQSSLPDQQPQPVPGNPASAVDPTFHQTVLEGVSSLALNRTVSLGSLEAPGSTRHTQVDVKLEKLP